MSNLPVIVKHASKKYEIELDVSLPGEVFKMQIFSVTGVEPERQKVLIKGGQLKDDTDLSLLGLKPGHTFLMMGTPLGGGLVKPTETIRFLEDMTEKDLAKVHGAVPSGLQNLGNTCYMNSTLQVLRSVPELHEELKKSDDEMISSGLSSRLPSRDVNTSLRELFQQMNDTTEGFPPLKFISSLRNAFPQFDQKDRHGQFAQQDAEECYSQLLTTLRRGFLDTYMLGKMKTLIQCDETDQEPAQESEETFTKLDCHISVAVNFLRDGILAGLTEKIEKRSEVLGRDATYTKVSKVSRLPKYLTCHLVRFFWKRDVNKKAKIMRKVAFPFQLDATEFCTDELKTRVIPVREKLRELHRDQEDRIKQTQRSRTVFSTAKDDHQNPELMSIDSTGGIASAHSSHGSTEIGSASVDQNEDGKPKEEDWSASLAPLLDESALADVGANHSALYELHAIVTHQGASADSGHYCAYVRKDSRNQSENLQPSATAVAGAEGSKWWFFNDEKVTEVGWDRIETLAGGGEAHSALILLYKALDMVPRT